MLKTEYLQAMGIPRWQLQKKYGYYELKDVQGHYRGGLIVQFGVSQSDAEQDLLANIIRALGLTAEETHSIPPQPRFSMTSTYSLAAMLANPKLKAPVWKALQNIFLRL